MFNVCLKSSEFKYYQSLWSVLSLLINYHYQYQPDLQFTF